MDVNMIFNLKSDVNMDSDFFSKSGYSYIILKYGIEI